MVGERPADPTRVLPEVVRLTEELEAHLAYEEEQLTPALEAVTIPDPLLSPADPGPGSLPSPAGLRRVARAVTGPVRLPWSGHRPEEHPT